MMKAICRQCLQVHHDSEIGLDRVVFSCFDQDQDLDGVDFANLRGRLSQDSLPGKVTRLWINRTLRGLAPRNARWTWSLHEY